MRKIMNIWVSRTNETVTRTFKWSYLLKENTITCLRLYKGRKKVQPRESGAKRSVHDAAGRAAPCRLPVHVMVKENSRRWRRFPREPTFPASCYLKTFHIARDKYGVSAVQEGRYGRALRTICHIQEHRLRSWCSLLCVELAGDKVNTSTCAFGGYCPGKQFKSIRDVYNITSCNLTRVSVTLQATASSSHCWIQEWTKPAKTGATTSDTSGAFSLTLWHHIKLFDFYNNHKTNKQNYNKRRKI